MIPIETTRVVCIACNVYTVNIVQRDIYVCLCDFLHFVRNNNNNNRTNLVIIKRNREV